MTPLYLSRRKFTALSLSGGFSALARPRRAFAAEMTEQEMLEALRSHKPQCGAPAPSGQNDEQRLLRELACRTPRAAAPVTAADEEERVLLETLKNRPARATTPIERNNLKNLAQNKPSIDIEINFDFNSDKIGASAIGPLVRLGRTLSNPELTGYFFLINGHTDAKGGDQFNQDLSERRAEAVKRVLIEQFKLSASTLIAVGYGRTQLKNRTDPLAGENRRVQIVNTEQQVVAGR